MITNLDFKNKVAASMEAFQTQTVKTDGEGKNLVVDGAGKGNITTQADETVVLLAEGDDLVFAESDLNQIEAQAGDNSIKVVGGKNTVMTENGDNKINVTGNINFVHTSDGDNTIKLTGDASTITTQTGNNDISAIGAYNIVDMKTGDNQVVSVGSFNKIFSDEGDNNIFSFGHNNEIDTDNGNNTILSGGNENKITTDNGNNTIISGGYEKTEEGYKVTGEGNDNVINAGNGNDIIRSTGNGNTVNGGDGKDSIISIGAHNVIDGQDGDDDILSIGNYNKIGGGEGNNTIVFDGNNLDITAGNGNNYIASLDFAIKDGAYSDYGDYLNDQITSRTEKSVLVDSTTVERELSKTVETTVNSATSDILGQLSDIDKTYLDKIDLNELTSSGQPKYLIAKGKSDGQYHIYEYSSGNTYKAVAGFSDGKRDYSKVSSGNGYLYLNGNSTKNEQDVIYTTTSTTTVTTQEVTTNTYADVERTAIIGNKNINITTGSGSDNIKVNVSKNLNINDAGGNNNIFVTGEMIVDEVQKNIKTEEILGDTTTKSSITTSETESSSVTTVGGSYSTGSPLIVDFNKDGQISAVAGQGVDIDNNGYADGSATGGDKMLAMTDLNGNSIIDGGEVFGDQTISPFTGEKINAANGFEALKIIAEQAESYTGVQCLKDGNVSLADLQNALKTIGVNLGFISDDNITELEDLGHVASINVSDYTEHKETGDVQHNQQGSYTDANGTTYKTDDVWFKLFGK